MKNLFLFLVLLTGMAGRLYAQHDLDVVNNLNCPLDVYYDVDDNSTCWTGAGPYTAGPMTTTTFTPGFVPGWIYKVRIDIGGGAFTDVFDCTSSCSVPGCPNVSGSISVPGGSTCVTMFPATVTVTLTPATPTTNAIVTVN